jgi:hypothetical protein
VVPTPPLAELPYQAPAAALGRATSRSGRPRAAVSFGSACCRLRPAGSVTQPLLVGVTHAASVALLPTLLLGGMVRAAAVALAGLERAAVRGRAHRHLMCSEVTARYVEIARPVRLSTRESQVILSATSISGTHVECRLAWPGAHPSRPLMAGPDGLGLATRDRVQCVDRDVAKVIRHGRTAATHRLTSSNLSPDVRDG